MYALGVKEFPDNLRGLGVVNCAKVLLHRSVVVSFLVEVVAILPEDNVLLDFVDPILLCEIDSKYVEASFVQDLELLLQRLLLVAVQLNELAKGWIDLHSLNIPCHLR